MPSAKKPKNILLISMDDAVAFWKFRDVFGVRLETPNLDRICTQSTAFHNAYCQAPVCSPSRASFMSGKAPHQSGVTASNNSYFDTLPASEMWPSHLKKQGFFCSSGGKVMRGYAPLPKAVHDAIFSDAPRTFQLGRRKRVLANRGDKVKIRWMDYGGYRDGPANMDEKDDWKLYDHQVATSAISFLDEYDGDAPFYREVGLAGTHGPWATPRRFKDMYNERAFKKPQAWHAGFDASAVMDTEAPPNINAAKARFWKQSVRNYFSGMSHTDHHIGRVFDALKNSRHAENTLVLIVSDHGMHLGERNRFRKHTLWEQVANIPLILHDPGRPQAQVITDPVGLIDIAPTVMDYFDLPAMPDRPGTSLRPLIDGAVDPDRAVPTFINDNAAIRQGKFRFIRYHDGTTQLYDLEADWWQTRNLGPDHPDHDRLQKIHATCCADYGFVPTYGAGPG